MLEIVNGENEDSKTDSVGFRRSAAERALAHASNDINNATEYLLSLPDSEPTNFLVAESVVEEPMATEDSPEGSAANTYAGGSPQPPLNDEEVEQSAASQMMDGARESVKTSISKRSLSLIFCSTIRDSRFIFWIRL